MADVRTTRLAATTGAVRRRRGRRQPGVRRRRARRLAARLPQRLPAPRRRDRLARLGDRRQPRVPVPRLGIRLGRQAQGGARLRRRGRAVPGRPGAHADLRRLLAQPRVRPPRRPTTRRSTRPSPRSPPSASRSASSRSPTSGASSASSRATGRPTPTTTSRATTSRCSTRASAEPSTCRPIASTSPHDSLLHPPCRHDRRVPGGWGLAVPLSEPRRQHLRRRHEHRAHRAGRSAHGPAWCTTTSLPSADDAEMERMVEMSNVVLDEDQAICEAVQRNLDAGAT